VKGKKRTSKVAAEPIRKKRQLTFMATMNPKPALVHNMHVITLGTCFDVHEEPALESAVLHVQEVHGKHIILDLQALTILDSRALGKLFLTYHHLNRNQIRLSIVNPRPAVREMLEFVNFPQIVPIFDSVDEVVACEHRHMKPSGLQRAAW
jgi:anti-anti-sigma factor